jgi:hypothetical protein
LLRSSCFELASDTARGQRKARLGKRSSDDAAQRWRTERDQRKAIAITLQNDVHATAADREARASGVRARTEQDAFDSPCEPRARRTPIANTPGRVVASEWARLRAVEKEAQMFLADYASGYCWLERRSFARSRTPRFTRAGLRCGSLVAR